MSEPQQINEILPQVLLNIKNRCNRYRRRHGLPLLREGQKREDDYQGKTLFAIRDLCLARRGRAEGNGIDR